MGSHSTYLSQSKMRGQELLWKTRLGWGRIQRTNRIAGDEPITCSTLESPRSSIMAVKPIPDGYATVTPYYPGKKVSHS